MWLANSAAKDGCCDSAGVHCSQLEPSPLRCSNSALQRQTMLVQLPLSAYFFFLLLDMFFSH